MTEQEQQEQHDYHCWLVWLGNPCFVHKIRRDRDTVLFLLQSSCDCGWMEWHPRYWADYADAAREMEDAHFGIDSVY